MATPKTKVIVETPEVIVETPEVIVETPAGTSVNHNGVTSGTSITMPDGTVITHN